MLHSNHRKNTMPFEIRKAQMHSRLFHISIPKRFADWLRIERGSLMKITFDSDEMAGNRLIIQPLYFKDGEAI
jgi:hypothetical protein